MFAKESLVQFLAGAGCFSLLQMLLLVVLGAVLVSNEHYHQLMSNHVKRAGGGLIFTGALYSLTAVLGYLSARTQNKCLLLATLVVLLPVTLLQLLFGSIALGRAAAPASFAIEVACVTVGSFEAMPRSEQQQCERVFRSDQWAGASLAWQSFLTKSVADGTYRAMLLNLQRENYCCGNGLPLHCVNDSRAFPSAYPSATILPQRQLCETVSAATSSTSYAYAPTEQCSVDGHCNFELSYGSCGTNPVTTSSRGCAPFVFQSWSRAVMAIGALALAFLTFPVRFGLLAKR